MKWCLMLAIILTPMWGFAYAPAKSNNSRSDMGEMTPERESAAMKFAELHHPELVALLTALKETNTNQFHRAVEEIFRTSEKLARLKTRSKERYQIELDLWIANSRLNLLIASLAMSEDREKVFAEIEAAITHKMNLQTDLMEYEAESLRKRLSRIEQSIETANKKRSDNVERQMKRVREMVQETKARTTRKKSTTKSSK